MIIQILKNLYINIRKNDIHVSIGTILEDVKLQGKNVVGKGTKLSKVNLGKNSYVAGYCNIFSTEIGKFCSIANYVHTVSGNHPSETFVSTHPSFFSTLKQAGFTYVKKTKFTEYKYSDSERKICVSIGNDVWIGQGANIINGITIGDGAIVAAGAMVVDNVPAYAIVGGVPAKVIKYRFSDEDIKFLLDLQWWNKSEDWIRKNAIYFDDIKKLKKRLEE